MVFFCVGPLGRVSTASTTLQRGAALNPDRLQRVSSNRSPTVGLPVWSAGSNWDRVARPRLRNCLPTNSMFPFDSVDMVDGRHRRVPLGRRHVWITVDESTGTDPARSRCRGQGRPLANGGGAVQCSGRAAAGERRRHHRSGAGQTRHLWRVGPGKAHRAPPGQCAVEISGGFQSDRQVVPQRKDAVEKVTGKAKYTGDITVPGMVYARILRPPAHGAKLKDVDTSAAEKIPGAQVVRDGDFIAVIHERPDMADKALGLIKASTIVRRRGWTTRQFSTTSSRTRRHPR